MVMFIVHNQNNKSLYFKNDYSFCIFYIKGLYEVVFDGKYGNKQ